MIYFILSDLYSEFLSVRPSMGGGGSYASGPSDKGPKAKGSDGKYQGE